MDIKSTTSLQDRIKALNIGKISQTPQQKQQTPQRKPQQVEVPGDDGTKSQDNVFETSKADKNTTTTVSRSSPFKINEIEKVSPLPAAQGIPNPFVRPLIADGTEPISPLEEGVYMQKPSNIPAGKNMVQRMTKSPSLSPKIAANNDTTIYASPLHIRKYGEEVPDTSETSVYSDAPNNIPIRPVIPNWDEHAEHAASEVYQIPLSRKNLAEDKQPSLGEDISSRWQVIRRTVKDPRLREMVDMSTLQSPGISSPTFSLMTSPNDETSFEVSHSNNEDKEVGKSPSSSLYQRSRSLVDALQPVNRNGSQMKRPSLPSMSESPSSPDFPTKLKFSLENRLSPESGLSRQSSAKSNTSTESGISRFSDISGLSVEFGRPRNESNVSVTQQENNYIAFESLSDATNDELAPNERTLVVVKGDRPYTGKLTLATEPESPREQSPGDFSTSPEELSSDKKKAKGKKLKAFGKLKKAVKQKMTSSTSPLATPTSATMPPRRFPQSPGKNMKSSTRFTPPQSPRHMTSPTSIITSPQYLTSPSKTPPSPAMRPLSQGMFTNLKMSTSTPTLTSADEGIYYDPSVPQADGDDVITVTFVEDGLHEIRDCDEVRPLTPTKRSQSLASLNQEIESVNYRKMSEDIGQLRKMSASQDENLYMVSSIPPVPPPKHKSIRKKAEKLATSQSNDGMDGETTYMTSMGFSSGQAVKLRNKKFTFDNDRQDWPNRRPPSMPEQIPPNPPRPPSMPEEEPPIPDESKKVVDDEEDYVDPAFELFGDNKDRTPKKDDSGTGNYIEIGRNKATKPQVGKKPPPHLPKKPTAFTFKPQSPNQKRISPQTPPTDDGIYHIVADPVPTTTNVTKSLVDNQTSHANSTKNGITVKPGPKPIPLWKTPNDANRCNAARQADNFATNGVDDKTNDLVKSMVTLKYSGMNTDKRPMADGNTTNVKPTNDDDSDLPIVKPPPRPLKLAKYQQKLEKQNEKNPALSGQNGKIRLKDSAVVGLEQLLSQKSALSPQKNLKTTPKSPKLKPGSVGETPDPTEISGSKLRAKPANLSKLKPSTPPPPPPTKSPHFTSLSTSSVTSRSTTSTQGTRPVNPIARLIQQRNETLPAASSEGMTPQYVAKPSFTTARRPKRPTVAPPPRPTSPPPPRPDESTAPETNMSIVKSANKTAPPSRPPPPSSEKIKAAEERKRLRTLTPVEDVEDEYNDMDLKHADDYNPYAAIDDDTFKEIKEQISNRTDTTPTPPARHKQAKRLSSQLNFGVISNVKAKLGKQKNTIIEAKSPIQKSIVLKQSTYNGMEDEGVYAGIDDFDFPPQNFNNNVIMSPKHTQRN